MKQTKRRLFVAFLLIFVLSLTACSQGKSDKGEKDHNEIATNVFHDRLSVTSKVNGNTVSAQALTFNPADGYLPVVYDTNAGWASTLDEQFKKAYISILLIVDGKFMLVRLSHLLNAERPILVQTLFSSNITFINFGEYVAS